MALAPMDDTHAFPAFTNLSTCNKFSFYAPHGLEEELNFIEKVVTEAPDCAELLIFSVITNRFIDFESTESTHAFLQLHARLAQ